MRIESNRPVKAAAARRDEKAGTTSGATFSELLSSEPAAASASAAPVGGVGSLLALQEISDETARRRQASERGAAILDRLDELRLGLLSGTLGRDKLTGLAQAVRAARVTVADPRLQDVLDEIELRAEVELAKLASALA
jgi:hypothetical protein